MLTFILAVVPVVSGSLLRQFPPPAAPAAPPVCPGDMSKRVWYACMGPEFRAPTADETVSGVTVANEMCCTEEFDFECLCCVDFSVPLQKCAPGQTGFCLSRCGAMDLDAANEPPGSPLAMVDDAAMPAMGMPAAPTAPGAQIVTVCTKETGVGAAAAGAGAVQLPVQCIPREFTVGEISGQQPDLETGAYLLPGQVLLDERIDFLVGQGLEAPDIPTCTKTYMEKYGGSCPMGTAKANQPPNSASDAALGRVGAFVSKAEEPAADAAFVRQESEQKKHKWHGRTFKDLAGMTEAQIEKVLGESKQIAFSLKSKLVRLTVDKVTAGSELVLTAGDKEVKVSGEKVLFKEGEKTEDVDPSTTVISTGFMSKRMGRRGGGFLATTGSFTLSSGSNTAGND